MYSSQRGLNYLFNRFSVVPISSCFCDHEVRPIYCEEKKKQNCNACLTLDTDEMLHCVNTEK